MTNCFNPRLRVGGDAHETGGFRIIREFQSTPPRGRRPEIGHDVPLGWWFQSTPPRGRRPANIWGTGAGQPFQSTPPRGRRPAHQRGYDSRWQFQSTPPRGRRPALRAPAPRPRRVSIHASAWEATSKPWEHSVEKHVSIHASAWEATEIVSWRPGSTTFQSTPPRGRRPRSSARSGGRSSFNPRLRVGGDWGCVTYLAGA